MLVVVKHLVVVLLQELGAQDFVSRQQLLERREGIGGDVERGHLDVAEKVEELVRMKHDLGERLVPGALPQHGTTV